MHGTTNMRLEMKNPTTKVTSKGLSCTFLILKKKPWDTCSKFTLKTQVLLEICSSHKKSNAHVLWKSRWISWAHPSSAGNIGRALKELQQKQQLLQVNDSWKLLYAVQQEVPLLDGRLVESVPLIWSVRLKNASNLINLAVKLPSCNEPWQFPTSERIKGRPHEYNSNKKKN